MIYKISETEISEKISAMKAGIDAGEKELQRIQQERESDWFGTVPASHSRISQRQ